MNNSQYFNGSTNPTSLVTSSQPAAPSAWAVAQNLLNGSIGLLIIIPNLFVSATILFSRKLRDRRELIILCGLTSSEVLLGIANAVAAFRFYGLVVWPETIYKVSAFGCFLNINTSLFILAPQLMTLMLVAISLDRLICVASINTYLNLTKTYAWMSVCIPYAFSLASWAAAAALSALTMPTALTVNNVCYSSDAVPKQYYLFYNIVQLSASVLSVALYAAVLGILAVRASSTTVSQGNNSLHKHQKRRQARVTRTLGMMSFATLITYVLPLIVITYITYGYNGPRAQINDLFTIMKLIQELYSVVNIVIFLARPSDVRTEMRYFFTSKILGKRGRVGDVSEVTATAVGRMSAAPSPLRANSVITTGL